MRNVLIEKVIGPKFILDDGTKVFVNKHGRERYGTPASLWVLSQAAYEVRNPIIGQIVISPEGEACIYLGDLGGWVLIS